jgi:hypothetical protein
MLAAILRAVRLLSLSAVILSEAKIYMAVAEVLWSLGLPQDDIRIIKSYRIADR